MNGQECNTKDLSFLNDLRTKYANQPTFIQAVEEMASNLLPLFEDPKLGDLYKRSFVALAEPERTISFRVPWEDDKGKIHYNRGWRVEFSRYVRNACFRKILLESCSLTLFLAHQCTVSLVLIRYALICAYR